MGIPPEELLCPAVGVEYLMKQNTRSRVGIKRVTDADVAAMAGTGVSDASTDQSVADRSGSDDKNAAVAAEGAKPKVPTYTTEGRAWIDADRFGLKTEGLYGQRGRLAVRPEDVQLRAQFLGRPNDVADLEELHGPDTTAPSTVVNCTTCEKPITSFVKTAMVGPNGDLRRDQDDNVTYRGQFVVTGKPLAVHAAHVGDCLYKLRDARGKKKQLPNKRFVADLLPSQSFAQANARLTGIQASFQAKTDDRAAMKARLGFTGDTARSGGGFTNGASFTPKTPRGQSRTQPRRWAEEDAS